MAPESSARRPVQGGPPRSGPCHLRALPFTRPTLRSRPGPSEGAARREPETALRPARLKSAWDRRAAAALFIPASQRTIGSSSRIVRPSHPAVSHVRPAAAVGSRQSRAKNNARKTGGDDRRGLRRMVGRRGRKTDAGCSRQVLRALRGALPGFWNVAKMSEYVAAYSQAYEEVGHHPRSATHPVPAPAHTPPTPTHPSALAGAGGPRQQHPRRPQGAATRGVGRTRRRARWHDISPARAGAVPGW
jgi:hypothetical protein